MEHPAILGHGDPLPSPPFQERWRRTYRCGPLGRRHIPHGRLRSPGIDGMMYELEDGALELLGIKEEELNDIMAEVLQSVKSISDQMG